MAVIVVLLIGLSPDEKIQFNLLTPCDGCASQAWRLNFAGAWAFSHRMKTLPISGSKLVAMIDDGDYEFFSKWSWKLSGRGYVCRTKKQPTKIPKCTTVYLHKEIFGASKGQIVDHNDRNPLNCQRYNLRPATKSTNAFNAPKMRRKTTSKFKGVWWSKQGSCWRLNLIKYSSTSERDAAEVYDEYILKTRGEFAVTNKSLGLL